MFVHFSDVLVVSYKCFLGDDVLTVCRYYQSVLNAARALLCPAAPQSDRLLLSQLCGEML